MKKDWLVKLTALELLESICLLYSKLEQAQVLLQPVVGNHPTRQALLASCETLFDDVTEYLAQTVWPSFSADEATCNAAINQFFNKQFNVFSLRLEQLSKLVWTVLPQQQGSELSIVFRQQQWASLMPDLAEESTWCVAPNLQYFRQSKCQTLDSPQFHILMTDPAKISKPLSWVYLLEAYFNHRVASRLFIERLESADIDTQKIEKVASPLMLLRLLGPAYYVAFILSAVQSNDWKHLFAVEPLLFEALSHFNQTDPSFVFLHQSVEAYRQDQQDEVTTALPEQQRYLVFEILETLIPQRLAFNNRQFEQLKPLINRLRDGMLIAAHPSVISIENALTHDEQAPVKSILDSLREQPTEALEVLNAGWLFKVAVQDGLFAEVLNEALKPEGFDIRAFSHKLNSVDAMLQKSIEVASLHRMLCVTDLVGG